METITLELPAEKYLLRSIARSLETDIDRISTIYTAITREISQAELKDEDGTKTISVPDSHRGTIYHNRGMTIEQAKEELERYKENYKLYNKIHNTVTEKQESAKTIFINWDPRDEKK